MLRTKLIILVTTAVVVCGAQFAWAYPPAGYDVFNTSATIEVFDPGDSTLLTEILEMDGYAVVWRGDPYDAGGGYLRIDTRMDTLLLRGYSIAFGDSVFIVLDRTQLSEGAITQQSPGIDWPADSYFDINYKVIFTDEPSPPKSGGGPGGSGATHRAGFDYDLDSRSGQLEPSGPTSKSAGRAVLPDGVSVELSGLGAAGGGIYAGPEVNFNIYYSAYHDTIVKGVTNGFRIYSPGGASWTPPVYEIDSTFCAYFDLYCAVNEFNLDGSGADTIGINAVRMTAGMPSGSSGKMMTITTRLDTLQAGTELCIDSSFYRPSGHWLWAYGAVVGSIPPPWYGPYCWSVINLPDTTEPAWPPHVVDPIGSIPPLGGSYVDPRKTPIIDPLTGDTIAFIWHKHRPEPPGPGVDTIPTWGSMDVFKGPVPPGPSDLPDEVIVLSGDAVVSWSEPVEDPQGFFESQSQLVEMDLTGDSPWGPAILTVDPLPGQSIGVSTGTVEGDVFPMESYLDVYYQVEFPDSGWQIIPEAAPPHMVAEGGINSLPPFNVVYKDSLWHAIVERSDPLAVIGWVRPTHWAQPPAVPGACCDTIAHSCRITLEAFCSGPNDVYQGDNEPCTPDPCCCIDTIRGNVDWDFADELSISDLIFLVEYMFENGDTIFLPCEAEADVDCDGVVTIGDLVLLVDYMFIPDSPPPCPCDCDDPPLCTPPKFGARSFGPELMKWSALVIPKEVSAPCKR
ncbi:MAG: hypothetical protein OEV49_00585 [candidate division Zixibacteria bacterium]|nr:hypothetical protein [candidate division Zixibacteria bacterium]MDH3937023.1 hypothetical protein [candidate division Zixibacteria bacterium]MDH4032169.1 hypothetical protein [candidate division Zixibacteria bacterium]